MKTKPITFIGPRKSGSNCPHKMAIFGSVEPLITGHAGTSDNDGSSRVNTEDDKPSNLSSEFLFKNILKNFPGHLDTEGQSNRMRKDEPEHVQDFLNKQFQNTVKCPKCNTDKLINYKYNKNNLKTNFIILYTIKKVIPHTKYCEICDLIVYPDLSEYNLINIYNRHIITYNFYLFILNIIFNSTCVIEIVIEHLIQLRTKSDVDLKAPRNVAQDLYLTVMTIAVGSITEQDMNAVVCPECGIYPN